MTYNILFRDSHRNAYECLWSEHRARVLAVSVKKYQLASSKLGKIPQYLGLLKLLNDVTFYNQTNYYYAVLTVYDEIKELIERKDREEIINKLLSQDPTLLEKLYELGKIHNLLSIQGCRLFFPNKAINKFYDHASLPGLWILLGPKLIHLSFHQLKKRLEKRLNLGAYQLNELLEKLKNGLEIRSYLEIDYKIRAILEAHCFVAVTNSKAWLHYAIPVPLPNDDKNNYSQIRLDFSYNELYTYLVLEYIWDSYKGLMPKLPDFEVFKYVWRNNLLHEIAMPHISDEELGINYKKLSEDFIRQKKIESGGQLDES